MMLQQMQDIYAITFPFPGTVKGGYSGKHRDNRVLCKEIIVSAIFMFAPLIIDNVVHYI